MNAMMTKMTSSGRPFFSRLGISNFASPATRTVAVAAIVALIGSRAAHAFPAGAPEIDPNSAGAALSVLAGSALVLRAHLRSKRKP